MPIVMPIRSSRLAARWPDDDLVAILAAEAIMDAQPWDYWQAGGKLPKGRIGEALALVEKRAGAFTRATRRRSIC